MRDMVEHGQTSGSRQTTVLSGVSSSSRLTRWISVATPITDPLGAAATPWMRWSVDPTRSATSTTSWAHSGWTMTIPSGCSARNAVTCSGRNRWCTEQWPFHKQQRRLLHLDVAQPAQGQARVPHPHVVRPVAQLVAGVAAQVLVGEEEDLLAPPGLQSPGQDGPGVRRGAHRPAVAPDERLQGGRRVHVGDGHDPVDVGDPGQLLPGLLHLVDVGHVGHGAAGVEVGQEHPLVVPGQDVGRLGHEVDAAEDDELGLGDRRPPSGRARRSRPGHRPSA